MDIIFIRDFRVKTLIGIYPWERKVPQNIRLDLEIALPNNLACHSDNIKDALDYALIIEKINSLLSEKHFSLLEALAENIAVTILHNFRSPWVKVSVAKLSIIPGVQELGVCIERRL
ncbi:MAG: dihydroneopterin aldolase [Nitrosomonas sp.]|nr:dihydroneopterin aldolase [Nitrosomonas sp.]